MQGGHSAKQDKYLCHEYLVDTVDSSERGVAYLPDWDIPQVEEMRVMVMLMGWEHTNDPRLEFRIHLAIPLLATNLATSLPKFCRPA
jgi:hypothetical protein